MNLHLVRELTPEGFAYAARFLDEARNGTATVVPKELLTDRRFAKEVATECYVEKRSFANRREAGKYLSSALESMGIGNVNGNYPLWSWLGLHFLEVLVDHDEEGRIKLGRTPDHAVVIDKQRTHPRDIWSHRLMLAWETYLLHGDQSASWILNQPVESIPRLLHRTIRSRQRFQSKGIVKLIGLLYLDSQSGRVKQGAAGDHAVGGVVRLNDVLDQLYMTYDVYGMRAEQLLALLPEEFQQFNAGAGSARQRVRRRKNRGQDA